jgi:dipeptide/tripeptide permease
MSKPVTDQNDRIIRRMLFGFAFGAIGAVVLVIVIAYLRGIDFNSEPLATNPSLWPSVLSAAFFQAAPLGAIYMGTASITMLRAEKLVPAGLAIWVVTMIFALVGEGFIAPLSPLWVDASIGFWVACLAISAQHSRRRSYY